MKLRKKKREKVANEEILKDSDKMAAQAELAVLDFLPPPTVPAKIASRSELPTVALEKDLEPEEVPVETPVVTEVVSEIHEKYDSFSKRVHVLNLLNNSSNEDVLTLEKLLVNRFNLIKNILPLQNDIVLKTDEIKSTVDQAERVNINYHFEAMKQYDDERANVALSSEPHLSFENEDLQNKLISLAMLEKNRALLIRELILIQENIKENLPNGVHKSLELELTETLDNEIENLKSIENYATSDGEVQEEEEIMEDEMNLELKELELNGLTENHLLLEDDSNF